jgi:hypothetical protein
MYFRPAKSVRTIAPLAALALLHAFGRYIGDPRDVEGLIRPLMAIWFAGLGATYALTWVGHDLGRRMMPVWGIGSALGFLLDNAGLLSIAPTPQIVIAWNWVGVGLGVALAVTALAARN